MALPASAQTSTPPLATAPIDYRVTFGGFAGIGMEGRARDLARLLDDKAEPVTSYAGLRRRLDNDIKVLRQLLISEAYYGARLDGRIRPTPEGRWQVEVLATPGPRYEVGGIDIALDPADATLPDLEGALGGILLVGDPARADTILAADGALALAPKTRGYPFAELVSREVVVDHARHQVTIRFRLRLGPRVAFGPIAITGARSVKPSYITRLAPWKMGDVYDQDKVDLYLERLSRTGLFNSITVAPRPALAHAQSVDPAIPGPIEVAVTEGKMRTISLGAGYSSTDGFSGEAGWAHRNILGAQERLRLRLLLSELEQSASAKIDKPNFRRPGQTLLAELALAREGNDAFTAYSARTSLGLERQIGKRWVFAAATKGEFTQVIDNAGERNFFLAALPLSARWDGTDNLLDPRGGARLVLTAAPELGIDGGVFGFTTTTAQATAYYGLGRGDRHVLAGRLKLGSILGAGRARLPANRRFFAGGGGSVRGFGYQNVGPVDATGEPLGGLALVEMGLEARVQISQRFGLVPFVDAGNVYPENIPKFSGLRFGGGLGFRYYTDFAPIRLDLATPLDRRPGEGRVQVYISIGQSF
ncbi:MAG: autotransporter assembly complex protein TamA [Pseudomonadota bacterium]